MADAGYDTLEILRKQQRLLYIFNYFNFMLIDKLEVSYKLEFLDRHNKINYYHSPFLSFTDAHAVIDHPKHRDRMDNSSLSTY